METSDIFIAAQKLQSLTIRKARELQPSLDLSVGLLSLNDVTVIRCFRSKISKLISSRMTRSLRHRRLPPKPRRLLRLMWTPILMIRFFFIFCKHHRVGDTYTSLVFGSKFLEHS